MNNTREGIRSKQALAEARNVLRRIKHLERTGQAVPTELFDRRKNLEQRLRSARQYR